MFTFLIKHSRSRFQNDGGLGISATTQLGFLRNLCSSSPKTTHKIEDAKRSFTVSYLINSCGLSPEIANSVSEKVNFPNPTRPDSVLSLLRDHGFANLHISKLVSKCPKLLLAKPDKTLLPKLDFFRSLGLSSTEVVDLVASVP